MGKLQAHHTHTHTNTHTHTYTHTHTVYTNQHKYIFYSLSLHKLFLKDLVLFVIKIYRVKETQREGSYVYSCTPQGVVMITAELMQSQELLLGLPPGCRVPRLSAVLYCFPRTQARSWMRKWRSQDMNFCPYVMLALQAEASLLHHGATPLFYHCLLPILLFYWGWHSHHMSSWEG